MPVTSDRLRQLRQMLEKSPQDTFLLYGIAMEHKKAGDAARAVEFFDRVIQLDPGYCYAYHQKGLAFESVGDTESVRNAGADARADPRPDGPTPPGPHPVDDAPPRGGPTRPGAHAARGCRAWAMRCAIFRPPPRLAHSRYWC